jgi:hypothetical protein
MSTSLYRLPLSVLEGFDREGVVKDSDLAALKDRHSVDQGLAYFIVDKPDMFAYILKPEGRLPQQHQEVSVGYLTPRTLKARLKKFQELDIAEIEEDFNNEGLPDDYLQKHLGNIAEFLRTAADADQAVLIVHIY